MPFEFPFVPSETGFLVFISAPLPLLVLCRYILCVEEPYPAFLQESTGLLQSQLQVMFICGMGRKTRIRHLLQQGYMV